MLAETRKTVFFDGTCNFCNASVDFLIRRNPRHTLQYSCLQSKFAQRFFADRGVEIDFDCLDRLYYYADGKLHARSGAALRIVRELDRPWPLLGIDPVTPYVSVDCGDCMSRRMGRTSSARITPAPMENAATAPNTCD